MKKITAEIMNHPSNIEHTRRGYLPLFSAHQEATIALIGQAPGIKAQMSQLAWNDASGKTLQRWLGVTPEEFYDKKTFAIIPMDFYYPGKGKSGDLPPRRDFALYWHKKIFDTMPNLRLKLLIGQYAQKYYLGNRYRGTLTETVKNYSSYLQNGYFPLPHPSPRNNIWMKKNPWFETEVIPVLQKIIKENLRS